MSIKEIYDNNNVFVLDTAEKTIIIKKTNEMVMKVTEWKINGKQELEYYTDRQLMSFIKKNKSRLQVRR